MTDFAAFITGWKDSSRSESRVPACDESEMLELEQDLLNRLAGAQALGIDCHFGGFGRLVGIGDTGELLDDARPGLLVQALAIALLADLQGCRNVNFDKAAVGRYHLPNLTPSGRIGRDRCAQGDTTVLCDF